MFDLHRLYDSSVLFLIALIVPVWLAGSGIIRHDADIEEYRKLGALQEYESVGRYASLAKPADYAAGVLVAPRWVLTAAHFPEDSSAWVFGGESYQTKRIVRHPKLTPDATETQWTGWDLALVKLERAVRGVAPAVRYRGRSEVGNVITKVGYGYRGNGEHGLDFPRVQERLAGTNVIEAAGGTLDGREFSEDVLVFDFDSPTSPETNRFGAAEPLPLEIGGSKGDSGGGVFLEVDGAWQLCGIVSGGLVRDVRYGSVAALARVSSANAWIDSVVGTASTR